jgi:hypothetical protein
MSGAGILPASDANGGGDARLPASPEHGRDARATRFSNFLTRSKTGMTMAPNVGFVPLAALTKNIEVA